MDEAGTDGAGLPDLRADCASCAGLCCIVLGFGASADFALDKPAGRPCPNLAGDHTCTIHAHLRERGFAGCTAYDCLGAGQRVTRAVLAGRDPRTDPAAAADAAAAYPVVHGLHEVLRYLAEAVALPAAAAVRDEAGQLLRRATALAAGTPSELADVDLGAVRAEADPLLRRAAELVRATAPAGRRPSRVRPGGDLVGADLRRADLRGADLRRAVLLGADLRGTDLAGTDLRGADLRAADLRGADLRGALFVTGPQLAGARGDGATRTPPTVDRPAHWTPGPGSAGRDGSGRPGNKRAASGVRRRAERP